MKNKNAIVLRKIIKYAKSILKYTENMTYQDFINNNMVIEACVFNISQIGELVKVLDDSIIKNYTNVKWMAIKGLRNRIVHDYEGIQIKRIWRQLKVIFLG